MEQKENPCPHTGVLNIIDPEYTAHPQPAYARVLANHRVAKSIAMHSPILSRYEDVVFALRHPEIFSSEMDMQVLLGTKRPMIPQQIDPPRQTRYRKILDLRFSRPRMQALEPELRRHAQQLIDGFVERGECEFDQEFAVPLPCAAFLTLMGLPQEELDLFLELKNGIIRPPVDPMDMIAATEFRMKTGERIYAYFEKAIADRRARPQDDMVTYLTTVDFDGRPLSDEEILDICYLLLLGGLDTVTATLGCSMAYLASNPEQRRKLVAKPELIPNAVEELLRWETPVSLVPRVLKQNVTIGDVELREGALVNILLGAANVDPAEFPDAMNVDFERENNRHISFGAGAHRCLGSHLARMELRAALEEWHKRIPEYQIKPGAVPNVSPGIREQLYLPLVWSA
ncbi:cytochrome P450 [Candidatus Binatia bacterium]|jgi:cytochrome P450|nr:cytochrome P450 [Candidatus Binatia bacterium]